MTCCSGRREDPRRQNDPYFPSLVARNGIYRSHCRGSPHTTACPWSVTDFVCSQPSWRFGSTKKKAANSSEKSELTVLLALAGWVLKGRNRGGGMDLLWWLLCLKVALDCPVGDTNNYLGQQLLHLYARAVQKTPCRHGSRWSQFSRARSPPDHPACWNA